MTVDTAQAGQTLFVARPARQHRVKALGGDAVRLVLLVHLNVWVLLLVAAVAGGLLSGGRAHVVSSGSMEPAVARGAVVVNRPVAEDELLAHPSILTFEDPANPGRVVTHRVVETTPMGSAVHYVTRGDANLSPDSNLVPPEAVIGAVRVVIPYSGLPLVWFRAGQWLSLAGWGAAMAFGVWTLANVLAWSRTVR